MSDEILRINDLKVYYPVRKGMLGQVQYVKAVDGVSLSVEKGEVLGIVGESGCGKSTLGKAACKLIPVTDGEIILNGKEIAKMNQKELRPYRKEIQMIFQDPYASLNPRMTIHDIIAEPMIIHNMYSSKEEIDRKVVELLNEVGLDDYHAQRYPHEFSGGQRQRIGIARALATEPDLIIADEPVSALDVSIQSQVLNLLSKLMKERNLTMIFIAHDLSVVEHISNRVVVMYLGNIVEEGTREELYGNPMHPYSQALLDAHPIPDPTVRKERVLLEGTIPSALNPPAGCKFHTRCKKCMEICKQKVPEKYRVNENHVVYCHLYGGQAEKEKED
ncbi:MAG: dipeptide ABC transporter ATP-binding protein [Erysipelotrichaceae bacterium]|nr:dipeptide ABC transporter ATP-binding protein [Erysipelotrichaceae bacterium]